MGSSVPYQRLCHLALVAPKHVESSRTRDRTCVPCISRWILNHWPTRQVLTYINQDREALVQEEKDAEGIKTVQKHIQTFMETCSMTEKVFTLLETGEGEQSGSNSSRENLERENPNGQ